MDLSLPGHTSWPDLGEMLRTAQQMWSTGVLESANGLQAIRLKDTVHSSTFAAHVFQLREFVLYDSETAFAFWAQYGETREFESSIILVDFAPTVITLTVDCEDSSSFRVANAMLETVVRHRGSQAAPLNFWQRRVLI